MKNKRLVAALTIAIAALGGATAVAGYDLGASRVDVQQEPFQFPVNESGMSYGSALNATSPENEPDLVEAYGEDGKLGYVMRTDLIGEMPANPKEAVTLSRDARTIPVYARDGVTIVDTFVVDGG